MPVEYVGGAKVGGDFRLRIVACVTLARMTADVFLVQTTTSNADETSRKDELTVDNSGGVLTAKLR